MNGRPGTDGPDSQRGPDGQPGHDAAEAIDRLLASDYPVTDLLARAASAAGTDTAECVALAWERVVASAAGAGASDAGAGVSALGGVARGALLGQLVEVLAERRLLDTGPAQAPRPPAFLAADDRWAGWWAEEPPEWAPDAALPPEVIGALRQVPVGLRVLLVLRDAAAMSPRESEPIVNVPDSGQAALLDEAREAYVSAMDARLTAEAEDVTGAEDTTEAEDAIGAGDAATEDATGAGGPVGAGETGRGGRYPAQAPVPIQASDVSCDVIVDLIGRWLDGDMDDEDRDAYEQHLLFCPPCLVRAGKTRRALAALRETALRETPAASAGEDLRRRLARLAGRGE